MNSLPAFVLVILAVVAVVLVILAIFMPWFVWEISREARKTRMLVDRCLLELMRTREACVWLAAQQRDQSREQGAGSEEQRTESGDGAVMREPAKVRMR